MNENAESIDFSSLTQDPQALKKLLMAQVRARGGTPTMDSKAVEQSLVKQTLEAFLELEMEEHLGYGRYAAEGRGSGNSRNGTGTRTVRGDFGELEIETPRDRNGDFEPKLVAKRQTSLGNFSETVVSLYTRGMSTREIEDHIQQVYGVEISPQFVSRATEQLQQQITDWQSRPLERVYPVIFIDGLRVAVRTEKGVLKKCVYTVLGVNVAGRQEVLGLWIEETEGARFWLKVLNDLKARGVQDALVVCGDGLTGLPEAVCSASAIRRATLRRASDSQRHQIRFVQRSQGLLRLYAADLHRAERRGSGTGARAFRRQLGRSLSHVRSQLAHPLGWPHRLFQISRRFARLIYTTNAIESLHSPMRKNIATRKMFPHDDAVIKILFLNIRNFSNRYHVVKAGI
jgi:putative transposase